MKEDRRAPRADRGRHRWRFLTCALAAILIGSLGLAGNASAAPSKFVYELCDSAIPGGGVPETSFKVNPGVAFGAFQNCASPGGSVGISQYGQVSATFSLLNVSVPETPGGFVESETISAVASGWSPGNWPSHINENGWPANGAGETQRIFHIRSAPATFFGNGGAFTIIMSCDGNMSPCNPGGVIAAHYIAVTEVDPVEPTLAHVEGSVLAGGVLRGHQSLHVEATDRGGGLSRVELLVNGLPGGTSLVGNCNVIQAKNPSYEGVAAVTPSPCPAKLKGDWVLDTSAYPFHDGANTLQVCATDFSTLTEPNESCSAAAALSVDNSCTESPVAGGEILSAAFSKTHKESVTVPFKSAARLAGELANNAGDPIVGATICVQAQQVGAPGGPQTIGTATTDAHGHFVYKLGAGPNRRVKIGYRHDSYQVAKPLRYFAHIKPTIKVKPGKLRSGGEIIIHGKVPGPGAAERVVVLQASGLDSGRWYTFRRATTNEKGRYRLRYRFEKRKFTTTYRMRAVVPRQHGLPWEEGHSKSALVVVRGG